MKILVMCRGGNSRSVVMAYILKQKYNVDTLTCGYRFNSIETKNMLFTWADYIIVMTSKIFFKVPIEFRHKVLIMDVGSDKWFKPNTQLINLCEKLLSDSILVKENKICYQ